MKDLILTLAIDAFWASIASITFAMLFNVPKSALFLCGLGGAFTYTLREILLYNNVTIVLATFIASTAIGVIGVYWSRKYIMPRPIYTVPSIIALIPGVYAFEAMISLVSMNSLGVTPELIADFMANGLKAVSILCAIAFGLALPALYYTKRNKPII